MEFEPHVATAFIITTGVGFLMLVAGLEKHMLEWRRAARRCPSCGRRIEARTCGCVR